MIKAQFQAVYGSTTVSMSFDTYVLQADQHILPGLGGFATATWQSGNTLYVAADSAGLEAFDVTDLANPTYLGGYNFGSGYGITDVKMVGTMGYVNVRQYGLLSVDVSDPTQITPIAQAPTPTGLDTTNHPFSVYDFVVNSNFVYVAGGKAGLVTYAIDADGNFTYAGLAADPISGLTSVTLRSVSVNGTTRTLAYALDEAGGLLVYDVSDPYNMVLINVVWTGKPQQTSPYSAALSVDGNMFYVTDVGDTNGDREALLAFDVKNPVAPKLAGTYPFPAMSLPWQVATVNQARGRLGGQQLRLPGRLRPAPDDAVVPLPRRLPDVQQRPQRRPVVPRLGVDPAPGHRGRGVHERPGVSSTP